MLPGARFVPPRPAWIAQSMPKLNLPHLPAAVLSTRARRAFPADGCHRRRSASVTFRAGSAPVEVAPHAIPFLSRGIPRGTVSHATQWRVAVPTERLSRRHRCLLMSALSSAGAASVAPASDSPSDLALKAGPSLGRGQPVSLAQAAAWRVALYAHWQAQRSTPISARDWSSRRAN